MKRLLVAAIAVVAIGVAVSAGVASAGNGANVLTMANTPVPLAPIPGMGNTYNFSFFDGNGQSALFTPTYYQEVVTPGGVNNEVLKGTIANDTGHAVIYTADSNPYKPGATCWDFATGNMSPDWQMTISASGNYTLACHFGG